MELLDSLAFGFGTLLGWKPLLIIVLGVFIGILVGAMPGLSPSTGVALLVPFSYTMPPTLAIILLVSIYIAANYGGSITAVLINTPGTPAAAATAIDGYPMTLKGEAGKGLGTSLIASTVGGSFGVIILIVLAVPLAKLAVKFHPADYFALAIFGLTTVGSLGGGNVAKAMMAVLFGLLVNTIGIDPLSGVSRFTFGFAPLYDGFGLIPALIGLFALSVVFSGIEKGETGKRVAETVSGKVPPWLNSGKSGTRWCGPRSSVPSSASSRAPAPPSRRSSATISPSAPARSRRPSARGRWRESPPRRRPTAAPSAAP
jgi:putative tricarboxylic transport membrane protein